jgi:phosphoribosylamine--glycine ligase
MKTILVIGGGGREHAIAWRLAVGAGDTPLGDRRVLVCPGNAGIARELECVAPTAPGVEGFVEVAARAGADLVVVGPEQPLVDGLADALRERGVAVLGPSQGAALLEGSKEFMKQICADAGAPTAAFEVVDELAQVEDAVGRIADDAGRIVVKADGLCAGKGVVVSDSREDAVRAAREMLGDEDAGEAARFGDASRRVVLEERLDGEELSVIALCDGERALPFASARDHKRLLDDDAGPNTGGMGAVAPLGPAERVDDALLERAEREVFEPVLRTLRERGAPFSGFLYAGLMLTDAGPKILEFNVRFGDPEAQAVLYGTRVDLLPLFEAVARGDGLGDVDARALRDACAPTATVVLASRGYPDKPEKGFAISGLDAVDDDAKVFFAGVATGDDGALATSGGRVLACTASGDDVRSAIERAYRAADAVTFEGRQLRRDIGRSLL